MGRRIDAFIEFVRFLRMTEPKYSLEIAVFHGCLLIACIVLLIRDEYRLYAIATIVLWISLGIHTLRIRRVVKRKRREIEDHIQQSHLAYLQDQHDTAEKKKNHNRHAAETARLIALLKEDVEQAMQDEGQSGEKAELPDG